MKVLYLRWDKNVEMQNMPTTQQRAVILCSTVSCCGELIGSVRIFEKYVRPHRKRASDVVSALHSGLWYAEVLRLGFAALSHDAKRETSRYVCELRCRQNVLRDDIDYVGFCRSVVDTARSVVLPAYCVFHCTITKP